MSEINLPWLDPNDSNSAFPAANSALKEPEGLVAAGGDLKPQRVLRAYREGIFPWYEENQPILWWSPNPRGVFYPNNFIVHKRFSRTIKNKNWRITFDHSFIDVMKACAEPRANSRGTWITAGMIKAYTELFNLGYAHSFEVWNEKNELIGGIYGIALGSMFFGESMFSKENEASKVALLYLCAYLDTWEYKIMDTQLSSKHLTSLGGIEIDRDEYLYILSKRIDEKVHSNAWDKNFCIDISEWINRL